VAEKNDLEQLEVYTDRFPLLRLRKKVRKLFILINMVAAAVISTKLFENASISVILANSLVMIFDDPTIADPLPAFQVAENIFLALYTVEMVFKIVGMGFLFSENAYLMDSWNILDFVIVLISYFTLFTAAETETTVAS